MEENGGNLYYDLGHTIVACAVVLGSAWLGWKAAENVTGEGRKWAVGIAVFAAAGGVAIWLLP